MARHLKEQGHEAIRRGSRAGVAVLGVHEMNPLLRIEREGEVLVALVRNPPINAGALGVRQGLIAAIETLAADEGLVAAVIIGDGSTFIAGSDLREFGRPLEDPQLPAVIEAIERCPKPVIAAIHGAALGGGLELALGCDLRIASKGAVVGLPEVTLGMIPGAGGTQRLPRLIGVPRAIAMVCSGERLRAEEAARLGLVDEVVEGDLRQRAVERARLGLPKRRVKALAVPAATATEVEQAEAAAARAGKRRPQVLAAIEAVKQAAELPVDEALARERAVFQALRTSREAFALRHQFFAERAAAKRPELAQLAPRAVSHLCVIGGGTMGAGIAISALDAGFRVTLLEQDAQAMDRGKGRIDAHYASRIASGKLKPTLAAERQARLRTTLDWQALQDVDMVIEAVFEDLGVKQAVFERLAATTKPGTLLATNTSYLDVDAIAAVTRQPHHVIGLHFFSPAQVMRLVEVVRASASAPEAVATGVDVARRMGKLPVVTGNAFGFIGNRLYAAYRKQCEFMIEEGAYPEEVDRALQAFGFAMGPFAVADMSGLDIAWRMRQAQAGQRDPEARYVQIPDRLCERGRLGRKTGAGYYRYAAGATAGAPDPAVAALIEAASAAKGIARRPLPADEIQRRALLAMVNEAAMLLAEGVASRASDVDVVLVNGYGFPRWEGGPVFWARHRGREQLEADLAWLADLSGKGFVRANTDPLFHDEPA